jgi:hypothetical protein
MLQSSEDDPTLAPMHAEKVSPMAMKAKTVARTITGPLFNFTPLWGSICWLSLFMFYSGFTFD